LDFNPYFLNQSWKDFIILETTLLALERVYLGDTIEVMDFVF